MSNTEFFKKHNCVYNRQANISKLQIAEKEVNLLIKEKKQLKKMEKNASLISKPNAAQNIVKEILKYDR